MSEIIPDINDLERGIEHISGKPVYTYEYAEKIRDENLNRLSKGLPILNSIPQAGFQENVIVNTADVLIIGGKRGGGKSDAILRVPLMNITNPLYRAHGFRKEKDDIERALGEAAGKLYSKLATPTAFKWTFPSGATVNF